MDGVETMDVEHCRRLWRVFHQTYTICTVIEHGGVTDWAYRGKRHFLSKKQISLMEPGELHRNIEHTAVGSFHGLMLKPEIVTTLARELRLESTRRGRSLPRSIGARD